MARRAWQRVILRRPATAAVRPAPHWLACCCTSSRDHKSNANRMDVRSRSRKAAVCAPHRLIRPGHGDARMGGAGMSGRRIWLTTRAPVPAGHVSGRAGRGSRDPLQEAGERRPERRVRQASLFRRPERQRGPGRSLRGGEVAARQRRRAEVRRTHPPARPPRAAQRPAESRRTPARACRRRAAGSRTASWSSRSGRAARRPTRTASRRTCEPDHGTPHTSACPCRTACSASARTRQSA